MRAAVYSPGTVGRIAAVALLVLAGLTVGALLGAAVLDLVIGGIDLVHLFRGGGVAGVQVGMVFLGQLPVGFFHFFIGGSGGDAQNLIRILIHLGFLSLVNFEFAVKPGPEAGAENVF